MPGLASIDLIIILGYFVLSFLIGVLFTKKAGKSTEEYFLSGRTMPWWLLGISMAATNFSIDTPLSMTGFVVKNGLPGAWYHWAGGIASVAAAFLFSRLWRRARLVTDNELIEIRYSGKEAAGLRFFKGIYFGLIINGFVLAWVFQGLIKVVTIFGGWDPYLVLLVAGGITAIYTVSGGYYSVIITDFFQYILALGGSILLAVLAVIHVGGIDSMLFKLENMFPGKGFTSMTPNLGDTGLMPFSSFLILILVKWWAHKYSDGGGKHIQRMSSAKDERHAVWGTFFYATFTFVAALWPWILCGLCSAIMYPGSADPESNYPRMMQQILPSGFLGLCLVGLLVAFMSTVTTHINLGASYFVNDVYKRFMVKTASEKHYVSVSRFAGVGVMLASMVLSLRITSVGDTWLFVLSFASGAGLTWILRWFWWRVNPYTEGSAMLVSGIVATFLKFKYPHMDFTTALLIILAVTTPTFLIVTFLTPPSDEQTLKSFYERVQPSTMGWRWVIEKYNLNYTPYFKHALVNFALGVTLLATSNFGVGIMILKNVWAGIGLLVVSVILTYILLKRINNDPSLIQPESSSIASEVMKVA
jgi:Na+/proline symporter